MTQPTALYFADVIANDPCSKAHHDAAAAELRRLSEIETLYLAAMRGRHAMSEELLAVTAQRDALLAALKEIYDWTAHKNTVWATKARAAIKAVEGA